MSQFVVNPFFIPWVPNDPLGVRPPQPARKPIPGPSGFVTKGQVIRHWESQQFEDGASPVAADEWIAMMLQRIQDTMPPPVKQAAAQGVVNGDGSVTRFPSTPAIREGYFPQQPWAEMPANGIPFDVIGSIATPVAGAAEATILSFRVPFGLDGVIKGVYNEYTGVGFVQGAGDITWRIMQASKPVRNYNAINTSMGTLQTARTVEGGILIFAEELIEYRVTHDAASPLPGPGTRVLAALKGYYWPRT